MRSKAIYLMASLCAPILAVLIADAPVAATDNLVNVAGCSVYQIPANAVKNTNEGGDVRVACSGPVLPTTSGHSQRGAATSSTQYSQY